MNKGYTPMGTQLKSDFLVIDINTRACVAKSKIVSIITITDEDWSTLNYATRITMDSGQTLLSPRSASDLWMELQ